MFCAVIVLAVVAWALFRKLDGFSNGPSDGSLVDQARYWLWDAHTTLARLLGSGLALQFVGSVAIADGTGIVDLWEAMFAGFVSGEALAWLVTVATVIFDDARSGKKKSVQLWRDTSASRNAWVTQTAEAFGQHASAFDGVLHEFVAAWWAYLRRWGRPPIAERREGPSESQDDRSQTGGGRGEREEQRSQEDPADWTEPSIYGVLGLQPSATKQQVHAAWKRMNLDLHPDRNIGATPQERAEMQDRLAVINAAYTAFTRLSAV